METNYTNFFVFNIFSLCHSRESGNDTGGIGFSLGIGYWSFNGHWVFGPWSFFRFWSFSVFVSFAVTDN